MKSESSRDTVMLHLCLIQSICFSKLLSPASHCAINTDQANGAIYSETFIKCLPLLGSQL